MRHLLRVPLALLGSVAVSACTPAPPAPTDSPVTTSRTQVAPSASAKVVAPPPPPPPSASPPVAAVPVVHFRFVTTETDPFPRGDVALVVEGIPGDKPHVLSLAHSTCDRLLRVHDEADSPPKPGEILRALCYWAGAGDEWRVIRKGDSLLVQHRAVDESDKMPGEAFKEVGVLRLPSGTGELEAREPE